MSLKGVAESRESPRASFITKANDLFAGIAASIMTVAYGLSFAALIFSASLHTWLAYGIAATFMTTAIAASFVAARSSLPFAIAAPDGATAAVTATLAAKVAQRLIEMGPPDDLLAPVMIVLALATLLTGILLFFLGLARAGGAIRFIPYPVIGGFLSATGWLMVSGGNQRDYRPEAHLVDRASFARTDDARSANSRRRGGDWPLYRRALGTKPVPPPRYSARR